MPTRGGPRLLTNYIMIAVQDALNAIDKMPAEFDSHEFILCFLNLYPRSYGELLVAHNRVQTAHAEIANFLRNNSAELGITKKGERVSPDIFGNLTECALWTKSDK